MTVVSHFSKKAHFIPLLSTPPVLLSVLEGLLQIDQPGINQDLETTLRCLIASHPITEFCLHSSPLLVPSPHCFQTRRKGSACRLPRISMVGVIVHEEEPGSSCFTLPPGIDNGHIGIRDLLPGTARARRWLSTRGSPLCRVMFPITKVSTPVRLQLPRTTLIHPTFHVS